MTVEHIAENYRRVLESVRTSAVRAGRPPDAVRIIAASKTQPVEAVRAVLEAGATDIGENRLQEALPKMETVGCGPRWHFIGHVQTNKASRIARAFDMVHGVDSLRVAEAVHHYASSDKPLDVLIEVNTSGEASKFGCAPEETHELMDRVSALRRLRLRGLMTIGPLTDAPAAMAASFARLRNLLDEARRQHIGGSALDTLSMGMSDDFEIAIAEGSTLVRIGTAIFGPRRMR